MERDSELPEVTQGVSWRVRLKNLGRCVFRCFTRLRVMHKYSSIFRVRLCKDPQETSSGALSAEEWGPGAKDKRGDLL